MLHFRATPEEKQTIRENAGHAEVALSEWMRQRSLEQWPDFGTGERYEDPVTRESKAMIRQAHEEGRPVDVQVVPGSSAPTQPVVEEPLDITSGAHPANQNPEYMGSPRARETYEQFMERRVGELLPLDGGTSEETQKACEVAEAEWAQR